MFKKTTFAAALLAATVMSGMASAKTFVYCSEASPEGFDPGLYTGGNTFDATAHPIFNRLLEFKKGTTEVEPGLAESYEVSDDGLQYTFKLRPGVKFHTTEYFTPTRDLNADDVIFSYERQWKADNPWNKYVEGGSWEYFAGMGFPDLLQSIEKVDDLTVKFTLKRKEAPFLANVAMPFASIVSKEYADKLQADGKMNQMNQLPVGTGPFTFVGYQQDAVIRYKKNAEYWGEAPKIDDLVFAITTDASVRYQKLKANECQLIPYPNGRRGGDQGGSQPQGFRAGRPERCLPRLQHADAALRQGRGAQGAEPGDQQAGDRRLGVPGRRDGGQNPIPPTMWSYNDAVEDDKYDPEAAKAALEAAGVKDLQMKIWAMPVARPYMLNARRAAELIQSDFEKVGVKVEIVSMDWGEYLEKSSAKDRDGAVILGWTGDNGDPDNFLDTLLGCDAVGGNNRAQWCNQEFDDLVTKAKEASDQAERTKLYEEAQVVFKREAPWATLDHSLAIVPMRKNVEGFVQSPLGDFTFATVDIVE